MKSRHSINAIKKWACILSLRYVEAAEGFAPRCGFAFLNLLSKSVQWAKSWGVEGVEGSYHLCAV